MQATVFIKGPAMGGLFRWCAKEFGMNFYQPLSDTADRPSVATSAVLERNVYKLKAAPPTAVMFEQLEYLIGHSDGDCPPDCID